MEEIGGYECFDTWAVAAQKGSQTLTEFLVTINPNESFVARDRVFLSIRAF